MYELKPLDKLSGRWADEDLNLKYAYEAIEDKKLKERCITLWFENNKIKLAVEHLRQDLCACQDVAKEENAKCFTCESIDKSFPDLNTISSDRGN